MSDKIKAGVFKVKINWIIFKCPVNLINNILAMCKIIIIIV